MQPQDPMDPSAQSAESVQPSQPAAYQPAQPPAYQAPQPNYSPPSEPTAPTYEQLAEAYENQAAPPPEPEQPAPLPPYQPPAPTPEPTVAAEPAQSPPAPPIPTPPAMPPEPGQSPVPQPPATSEPTAQPTEKKSRWHREFKNPLEAMRPGERTIIDVRRHPIGIIGTYIGAVIIILALGVIGYLFAPEMFKDYSTTRVYGIVTLVLLGAAVLVGLFVLVAHTVYWGNHWVVTSDSITQVLQSGLFGKQSSQLSMANLEDITVEQNGILPHMFDYGVLSAETAGEKEKFRFPYCPHPNDTARQILLAREEFEQAMGHWHRPEGGNPYVNPGA